MTLVFFILLKFKTLSSEEKRETKEKWKEYKRRNIPKEIKIVGEYEHTWGTVWNGALLVETDKMEDFINWWPKFRDFNRWYVTETQTIIMTKIA
ncbi:MAG: hypothetical protein ACTSSJ_02650 [Candidatus Odinarchaeia archaeon]